MKTRNLVRQCLGYLALVAGMSGGPVWSQGATPQTLDWSGDLDAVLTLNTAHPLSATASSGLPVTLRVDAGPATLANGAITVSAWGTVWVTAEQAGDATYIAARLTRSFNVRQGLLSRVSEYKTTGNSIGVKVVGNYAFEVSAGGGLHVIDVSNPTSPVGVGGYQGSGYPNGVQVVGDYAYVADHYNGLEVIDVRDPARLVRVGGIILPGIATGVQVEGGYAYVAEVEDGFGAVGGLDVIDVSNPFKPVRVGRYATSRNANSVCVRGNYAYLTSLGIWDGTKYISTGMEVIDVSIPAQPVLVGGYGTSGPVRGVQLVGNYAYLAVSSNPGVPKFGIDGLQIVDVSNPASPVRVAGADTSGQPMAVQVVGNYAYVAEVNFGHIGGEAVGGGLEVIDVSNPAIPVLVGRYETGGDSRGVHVFENYAYVANSSAGLEIVGIRLGYGPTTIMWQGATNEVFIPNVSQPLSASASNRLPVTLRVESGPAVIVDGRITVTGIGTVVVTAEQDSDTAFLPTRVSRNFNVPQVRWSFLGRYDTSGPIFDMQVIGNNAYLAMGDIWNGQMTAGGGYQVIDVTNPVQSVPLSVLFTNLMFRRFRVEGNYACGLDGNGLQVLDVSDPATPVRQGGHVTSKLPASVELVGSYAYVREEGRSLFDLAGRLEIFDLSDPSHPSLVSRIDLLGPAEDLQVVGHYAYVLVRWFGGGGELQVMDVSNPSKPVKVGAFGFSDPEFARGLHVVGNYAYVAGSGGTYPRLDVVDVSNPSKPVRVGKIDLPGINFGTATWVQAVGNYAFVRIEGVGMEVIDVSNAAKLVRVGRIAPIDLGLRGPVQMVDNRAYLAALDGGLEIVEFRLGYPQTLELRLPAEVSFQGLPVAAVGAASSGLPLTLSVVSGPASVVNNQVTWADLGPVTLRAEQAGDDFNLPASAEWTVTVIPRRLSSRLAGGQVEVFWATGFDGLQLQGRESLGPESPWQNVTIPPVETDGEARVVLDSVSSRRYFRLLKR